MNTAKVIRLSDELKDLALDIEQKVSRAAYLDALSTVLGTHDRLVEIFNELAQSSTAITEGDVIGQMAADFMESARLVRQFNKDGTVRPFRIELAKGRPWLPDVELPAKVAEATAVGDTKVKAVSVVIQPPTKKGKKDEPASN